MVYVLLTLHNPEHFINPYVICNNGHGYFYSFAILDVCSKLAPFSYTKLSIYVDPLVYINCCTQMGMGVGTMWATTVLTVFEKIKSTDP